jgi:hypothetical protein
MTLKNKQTNEWSNFLFVLAKSGYFVIIVLIAPRLVRPRTKSGRETLLALNFWTIPAARHFRPWSFWTSPAPKFLDKSGPETSPAPRQVQPWDKSGPKVLGQVWPRDIFDPSQLFYKAEISSTWDKSSPETCWSPRHFRHRDIFVPDILKMMHTIYDDYTHICTSLSRKHVLNAIIFIKFRSIS